MADFGQGAGIILTTKPASDDCLRYYNHRSRPGTIAAQPGEGCHPISYVRGSGRRKESHHTHWLTDPSNRGIPGGCWVWSQRTCLSGQENRVHNSHPGGTTGMDQIVWKEAWSSWGSPDPDENWSHQGKRDRHHVRGDYNIGDAARKPEMQLWKVDKHGHLGHPPEATYDDWKGPPDGIGDPGPGLGRTPKSTHDHEGKHLSEGSSQNSHDATAC